MTNHDYSGAIAAIEKQRPFLEEMVKALTKAEVEAKRDLDAAQAKWNKAHNQLVIARDDLSSTDNAIAVLQAAQRAANEREDDDEDDSDA